MTLRNASTLLARWLTAAVFAVTSFAAPTEQPVEVSPNDPANVAQLRESIAKLTAHLSEAPRDVPARLELAHAYVQLSDFSSAETQLYRATADAPDNANAWAAYGALKCEQQQWSHALELLQKAAALGNTDGNTFQNLGAAYERAEDRTKALEYYTTAIENGCKAALLKRGHLHFLLDDMNLAIDDFNEAIELKENLSHAYLGRGNAQRCLKDINKSLADYSSAIDADPKLTVAYDARARLRKDVIGDFHGAIDDFTREIDVNPKSPVGYGARGTAYLENHEYDLGIADIKEAIRLNPNDLGQAFEPNTDKTLDPDALHHGEIQLRKMLADRPRMAKHVEKGDKLWNWAVRKFAGEDLGSPIDWDPTSPDPFASRSGPPMDGKNGLIQLNLLQRGGLDRPRQEFEQLWACTVFELYNVSSTAEWKQIADDADSGKLSRDEYIQAMMRSEYNATQKSRAFYIQFFLPYLRSKNLDATKPKGWFCEDFRELDNLRWDQATEANNTYLSYYENTYDMRAAYREALHGNYAKAKEMLARILAHPDGLTESERSYVHELDGWVANNMGDSTSAMKAFSDSLQQLARAIDGDPKSADELTQRGLAYSGLGRMDEAIADLNAAVDLEPKSFQTRLNRANVLARAGKYEDAKRDIEAALATDPQHTDPRRREAFNLRGYVGYYTRDYAHAVDDFTTAFDPNDPNLLRFRAYSLMALQKYDQALADLDALVRLQPTDASAYAWRGVTLHHLDEYQKALADYDEAIELNPILDIAFIARSELLSETADKKFRRPEQAMKDARRGCELTVWKDPEALRALASAYAATGDFASAIQWQKKALKIGDADHREEYSQLLAGYRKQVATAPHAAATRTRSCAPCANRLCSQRHLPSQRWYGLFSRLRFFRR